MVGSSRQGSMQRARPPLPPLPPIRVRFRIRHEPPQLLKSTNIRRQSVTPFAHRLLGSFAIGDASGIVGKFDQVSAAFLFGERPDLETREGILRHCRCSTILSMSLT